MSSPYFRESLDARRAQRLLVLVMYLSLPSILPAQQFGQWWWDGRIEARQRTNETKLAGTMVRDFSELELRAEAGLNGFLRHPALGRFRIAVEGSASDVTGGSGISSDRLGFAVDLDILPRSPTPLSVSYSRGSFDYQAADETPSFALANQIADVESWRGRLGLRRGLLSGILLGVDLTRATPLDGELRNELRQRMFGQWNRRIGPLDHTLRIDHEEQQYSRFQFDTSLWTASFDQSGRLGESWQWQLGAAGVRTEVQYEAEPPRRLDDLRLRHSLLRTFRSVDLLDLRVDAGRTVDSTGDTSDATRLGLAYRWHPHRDFELSPFLQAGRLSRRERKEDFSRAGLEVSWNHGARLDLGLSGRASFAARDQTGIAEPISDDLAFSGTATAGMGEVTRLRGELEVEWARNELRFDRIESGAPAGSDAFLASQLGEEDLARLRLRLHHQGLRRRFAGWIETRLSQSESLARVERARESVTGTVEGAWRKVTLVGNLGRARLEQGLAPEESLDFAAASLDWQLLRSLSLRLSYRQEARAIAPLPALARARAEGVLTFRLGLLDLRAEVYEDREELGQGGERRDRGLYFSVARDFAGWLPIVTGSRRRGAIR